MYKIIGGDGKEYGPISAEQLRQWISEGRISVQTMVQAEGRPEWRPLSTYPEFSAGIPPISPGLVHNPHEGREAALGRVKGPAIALIIVSILNVLLGVWGLIRREATFEVYKNMQQFSDPQMQQILQMAHGPAGIATSILAILLSGLILFGAVRMLALRNHSMAFTVSILAMIPCLTPCCLLGLPFGIWAIVVLNKPEVKAQFS